MAFQPILESWKNQIANLGDPSLQSIRQITIDIQGQLAAAMNVTPIQLGKMSFFLNQGEINKIFNQFKINEIEDGLPEEQADIAAANALRGRIQALLNEIVPDAPNDMVMDGGRKRHGKNSRKNRRYTRRR